MRTITANRRLRALVYLSLFVAGCGGGGGGGNSSPPLPSISITDQYVLEPLAGSATYSVRINLSAAQSSTVSIAFASADGSAVSGADYGITSGTISFLAGETSKSVSVTVHADATSERDESFLLTLSNPTGATLARSTGTITIVDRIPLNDTGITTCGDASSNTASCPQASYPGQDAESGRDTSVASSTDGRVGFEFTKLDASGNALATSAVSWSCVRDEVTGLVWEIKPNDPTDLRHRHHTYSWYNPDNSTNGGSAGSQTGGACAGGISCNTAAYVQAVNAAGLCGHNDWRVPTTDQLISIRDYGTASPPAIDAAYFPDVGTGYTYWAAESSPSLPANGNVVAYTIGPGALSTASKSSFTAHIRLVR